MTYTPNLTFTSGENAGSTKINQLLNNVLAIFPVGSLLYIHQSPTTVETTFQGKWIQCNGAIISRTTYATLFTAFGSADVYGGGNGTTTFGLPDLRGRMAVSVATSGHVDVNAFAKNDGAVLASRRLKHAHTFANGTHGHTWSTSTDFGGGHLHAYTTLTSASAAGSGTLDNMISNTLDSSIATGSGGGSHTHTLSSLAVNAATSVSSIGVVGTLSDQPAYIVSGCWHMAYAN